MIATTLLALAGSAFAHAFTWDGSRRDPLREGVTLRWDRSLLTCGDTDPFAPLKVGAHIGQTNMRAQNYLVVRGRRQIARAGAGPWTTLPYASDGAAARGQNGQSPFHATLPFYLRFVDRGMFTRVRLTYQWKRAAGEPGPAGDKLWATQTAFTPPCQVP